MLRCFIIKSNNGIYISYGGGPLGDKKTSTSVRNQTNLRELIYQLMQMPLQEKDIAKLKARGIIFEDPEQYTYALMMALGQFESATKNNNTRAFENFIGLVRESEIDHTERAFELPARMIGRSFVDVNRSISAREYDEYLFKGGRFSLKSSFIALKIVELIKTNPDTHAMITRRYQNTLRDSVFAQVAWAIEMLGDSHNWRSTMSPMQFKYLPTGQIIYFRGGDEPEKIKSIKPRFGYIAFLWYEEVDQFKGDAEIRNIMQSALRGGDIGLIFKSYNTPRTRAHWINKYASVPKPNMFVHHSTYKDAPIEWIGQFAYDEAELLRDINEKAYRHELLGEEIGDGGQVFDNVVLREISDAEIDNFDYVYHGQDWGWFPDPNRLVSMSYDANRKILYIYREEHGHKTPNEIWQGKIMDLKRFTIVADNAEQKSIDDFQKWGFDMRAAKKGPNSVHNGIKWLAGLTQIIIDPVRCPHTAQEFRAYEYERDKEGNPTTNYPDKNNHSIDAVRYGMEVVWHKGGL